MTKKLISIVTPCYNEAENVVAHFNRVKKAIEPFTHDFEFEHIYTDNCSKDSTFDILSDMASKNKNLKVLRFSRNIGANKSIFTGLSVAKGDAVVLIQADLQDPPELIRDFINGWIDGNDIVYGKISEREEFWILKNLRKLYYWIIAKLSDVPITQNAGEFRLMSRRSMDALMQFQEDDLYIRGAVGLIGFSQKPILYSRSSRAAGESSINFFGLIGYAINGLLSTTVVPLRLVSIFGFILSILGFIMVLVLIAIKMLYPTSSPQGITSLAVIIVFFSGIQVMSIGVLGEYIRKIYIQSLRRPRGFVKDKVNIE